MNIENARSRTGWGTCAGIAGLVLLLSPLRLHAQVEWSTTEEKARFERERTSDLGFIRVRRLLVEPGVPVAKRDSVVDGLVQFALHSGQPRARVAAVSMLSMVAEKSEPRSVPGVAARLAYIYDQSDDYSVRSGILSRIFLLSDQTSAVNFLKRVAARPERKPEVYFDEPDEPTRALVALARMGLPGRAALRELDRQGAVQSQIGRAFLSRIAPRDYSIEPGP